MGLLYGTLMITIIVNTIKVGDGGDWRQDTFLIRPFVAGFWSPLMV